MRPLFQLNFRRHVGFVLAIAACLALGASSPTPNHLGSNLPPDILSFSTRALGGGTYLFEGYVSDEFPDYCIIHFGGVLTGNATIVYTDGSFSYEAQLGPYDGGAVSAQAFDEYDQSSEVRWDTVYTGRIAEKTDK